LVSLKMMVCDGSGETMTLGMEDAAVRTQRACARMAGFLLLWLIVTGIAGAVITSHVAGSGSVVEVAQRVAASEHWYRAGLAVGLLEPLSTVGLAVALYVALKPVNRTVALFAMAWRLGEAFIGGSEGALGYAKLHLFLSQAALGAGQAQGLLDLLGSAAAAMTNISAIFFSVGSILFYALLVRSGYIPQWLAWLGVVASALVTLVCFGTLLLPEYGSVLQIGWLPMAVAEVVTGFWLMLAARIPERGR
jgi:hypothetical protein